MIPEEAKKLFVEKFSSFGDERFYKFLINYAINRIANSSSLKGMSPETELLDFYEKFLSLYRRENNNLYLEIAKIFRRAAHKIYFIMLKQGKIKKNNRFLNIVGK